jgi:hypothetical protein
VSEALPDHPINGSTNLQTNVISVPEKEWHTASKQFAILKPLLDMNGAQRMRADVKKVSKILKLHPAEIDNVSSAKVLVRALRQYIKRKGEKQMQTGARPADYRFLKQQNFPLAV